MTIDEFKCLSKQQCTREVKTRVQAGWSGCRQVSGVICDREIMARVKRSDLRGGSETVALTKRQEPEVEVAELKSVIWSDQEEQG